MNMALMLNGSSNTRNNDEFFEQMVLYINLNLLLCIMCDIVLSSFHKKKKLEQDLVVLLSTYILWYFSYFLPLITYNF